MPLVLGVIFIPFLLHVVSFCSGNPLNKTRLHKTAVDCYAEEKVAWPDGNCYSLLGQGPCEDGHWLKLASTSPTIEVECVAKPCQAEEAVWWQEECRCVQEDRQVCKEGEGLLWSPRGEGLCGCLEDHEEGEDGVCYEDLTRIFDLLPNNKRKRRANMRTCWVDSRGRCRRRRRFRRVSGRQGRKLEDDEIVMEEPQVEFLNWLHTFQNQSSSRECQVTCEGDQLPWVDGNCHDLVTQGPCSNGSWLVLHRREEQHDCLAQALVGNQAVMRCEVRRCGLGQIWWPETCSCVSRYDGGVCGAGHVLAVGPYGEGVCCKAQDSDIRPYILDLIPTNEDQPVRMCHVDENGACRRILKIRSLRRRNGFENFVDWLSDFRQRTKLNQNGECIL